MQKTLFSQIHLLLSKDLYGIPSNKQLFEVFFAMPFEVVLKNLKASLKKAKAKKEAEKKQRHHHSHQSRLTI